MIGTIREFTTKLFSVALLWRLWLVVLMVVNGLLPFLFFNSVQAKATLLAFLLSFVTGVVLYRRQGFTHLLGLMHWTWIPLLFFLYAVLHQTSPGTPFGLWLRSVILLNGFSLILDIVEVLRYVNGDRQPLV